MAAESGRPRSSLIATLFAAPRRFGFFQALRILDAAARRTGRAGAAATRAVGERAEPGSEVVRFRATQSLAFPAAEIDALEESPARSDGAPRPPVMTVPFLGLTGPSGVLPRHYSALLVRSLRQKNESLRDFLDVFNHRLLSLFYRAGTKYRLPLAYERSPVPGTDPISTALRGLTGFAPQGMRDRTRVGDQTLLHFAGLFGHNPRSAAGLGTLLAGYFDRPVRVEQFCGRWMQLGREAQTRLPSRAAPEGAYCELGRSATIGGRVWDVQGSFRLHVGPLGLAEFLGFLPDGEALKRMAELTELYVGPSLLFDIKLTLRREEVPRLRLAAGAARPRLGWNTWLATMPPARDPSDAMFLVRAPS